MSEEEEEEYETRTATEEHEDMRQLTPIELEMLHSMGTLSEQVAILNARMFVQDEEIKILNECSSEERKRRSSEKSDVINIEMMHDGIENLSFQIDEIREMMNHQNHQNIRSNSNSKLDTQEKNANLTERIIFDTECILLTDLRGTRFDVGILPEGFKSKRFTCYTYRDALYLLAKTVVITQPIKILVSMGIHDIEDSRGSVRGVIPVMEDVVMTMTQLFPTAHILIYPVHPRENNDFEKEIFELNSYIREYSKLMENLTYVENIMEINGEPLPLRKDQVIAIADTTSLVKEEGEFDADQELDKILDEEENRDVWGNKVEFLLASIGLAVGVGNVWRFPYLCQKNGGGAFLIPYFIMMIFQGFPLFIMEFAMGQRMKQSAVRCWNNVHPVFFGVGIACMLVSFAMCSYYIVVITWCLFYFFVSFTNSLPWQIQYCDRYNEYSPLKSNLTWWTKQNQSNAYVRNMTAYYKNVTDTFPDCCVRDPPQYYWYHTALQATSVIEQAGDVNWKMFGCLALGWLVVYVCVLKGVKSSGKAAYFTATFPYVLLFILFIRGVTLEGAGDGIKAFFTPDIEGILKLQAWMDAATQIFYSLSIGFGALIAFSSYMPRKNNCVNDALIVVLVNCGTSLFAGIVTFSFLGYRQKKTGIPVNQVGSGPGLAFMTYCEAFLLLDISPLWAILFFMMLVLLGIDSEFGTLEGAVAPLYDLGWVTMRKEKFMAIIAIFFVFLEIIFCLGDGYYLFQVFDDYSVPIPLLIIALFQVIALGWVYGVDRISNDIEYMTGTRPRFFWMLCWKYISPGILLIVFIGYVITTISSTPTYRGYVGCEQNPFDPSISEGTISWYKRFPYPWWTQILAAILVLISVLPIPYYFYKNWQTGLFGRMKTNLQKKVTYYPDPTWIEPERRVPMADIEKKVREEDKEILMRSLAAGGDERFIELLQRKSQVPV